MTHSPEAKVATLLAARSLKFAYGGAAAVRDVSLTVGRGEIVALIGSNGAGKTTSVGMIAGIIRAQGGTVSLNSDDVTGLPAHRMVERGITLVPEGRLIFPRMTVLENLEIGASNPRAAARLTASLDRVFELFPRLKERHRQLAGSMSGGEQQMLAIARGLMSCPTLLILDEPSLGLMPKVVSEIFRLIRRLNAEGLSVLLVEQNVRQTLQVANRAYILEKGTVVAEGAGAELLNSQMVREAYLGVS